MRKHIHISNALLRLTSVLLAALFLFGCAAEGGNRAETEASIDTAEILESKHDREPGYAAAFKTHMLLAGQSSVHMENRIYDETLLRSSAKTVFNDLNAAEDAVGEKPGTVTVYIVGKTLDDRPEAVGSKVFCTAEDISGGSYRAALLGAAYGLPTEWQQVGLSGYVFDEEGGADLKGYYENGDHALTASCSALYLYPVIADEETVLYARETARALAAFVIEKDGFSAFCETSDTAPVLPAWAESAGLSVSPALPEKSAEAAKLKVGTEKNYLCVLTLDDITIYATKDGWGRDPDTLYTFICDYFAGMDLVMGQIRAEAPAAYETAVAELKKPVRITLTDPMTTASYADDQKNEIHLSKPGVIWHETMHLVFDEPRSSDRFGWLNEGIAEHFTYATATLYASIDYISGGFDAYLDFFEDVSSKEANDDDMVFHQSVMNLYEKFRSPDAVEYDDQTAYFRAYGISSLLLYGVIERSQVRRMYDYSVAAKRDMSAGKKENDGNALSYPEAEVMYEYLAAVYGADAVIDAYLKGVSPEEAFSFSYAELFAAARAYYTELYGEYLALN